MRTLSRFALLFLATLSPLALAQGDDRTPDKTKIDAYLKTLPKVTPPDYNETERLALAANPLGCEEHPHAPGRSPQAYLWQHDGKPKIAEDYDKKRAFYGCLDWHSSVNSMWMMASLIKSDPRIAVAPAIRNEFEYHLQKANIDGEMAYFTHLESLGADFEKPYGYAWLIKLYGELKSWNDPEGQRSAAALEPLNTWMSKEFIRYLHSLNYPIRIGLHPNTALDMGFVLDSTAQTHDTALETAVKETALRLFSKDKHCPTGSEPVFNEFDSPCLTEAALMGRIMEPAAYAQWLTDFLPPVYAPEFQVYKAEIDGLHGDNRDTTGTENEGQPNAHLIGLNLQRAADFMWMARSLPPADPRVAAYHRFADIAGKQGYDKIGLGGYLGTHWLATYALMYENLTPSSPEPKPAK